MKWKKLIWNRSHSQKRRGSDLPPTAEGYKGPNPSYWIHAKELFQGILISVLSVLVFFSIGEIITRLVIGNPLITKPDEVLFWKYKKDQIGRQKLFSPISRVDQNGFRRSKIEFNPNLTSIYAGGDSFAWGEGVLDSETFSSQLQSTLLDHGLNYNVLNGGVPGYGIEQIINRMEIECEKFNPRYAIFLWVEGDIDRLRDISPEQKEKFLRDYKIRSIFRYSAFLKIIKERLFDKVLQKDIEFGLYKDRNLQYGNTHTFNEKIKGLVPKIRTNIAFLKEREIIPIWVFMTVPSKEFRDYLISLSNKLSVAVIDPELIYRAHFPGLLNMETKQSGHFKPEVYGLLADQVFDYIFSVENKRNKN